MVSPAAKRTATKWLAEEYSVSQRRACRVLELCLSTCRYKARRAEGGVLLERLRALAEERPRFGYRRLLVMLRRESQARLPSLSARGAEIAAKKAQEGRPQAPTTDDAIGTE